MRADYGLYVLAITCFVIAALPYYANVISEELLQLEPFPSIVLTVIFAALGLISIIVGYSLRPKPIISISEAPKPVLPLSEPTPPTPPEEETAEPREKKPKAKARRKRTRKRRKKS